MDFQKLVAFRNTHNPYAEKTCIIVEAVSYTHLTLPTS